MYIENNYEEIEILEIENIIEDKNLIDITVDEDETFCITDDKIISHNCKSMLRAITHSASKANCPVLFSNHTYDNPGALYPTLVKSQAGGSGPLYMSSVLVQMSMKQEKASKLDNKNAVEESTSMSKDVNGLTLRFLTTKNRFVTPFLETELYLNFKTGLAKYSGLLEMAEAYGVLEKQGHRYAFNGESLGFYKEFRDNNEVWEKILPVLDEKLQKELAFKNENSTEKENE
jgi:hypothetical protein